VHFGRQIYSIAVRIICWQGVQLQPRLQGSLWRASGEWASSGHGPLGRPVPAALLGERRALVKMNAK